MIAFDEHTDVACSAHIIGIESTFYTRLWS